MKSQITFAVLFFLPALLLPQKLVVTDEYLKIIASANDPLYTTYAATMNRRGYMATRLTRWITTPIAHP